jgi:hypothetical protein
MRHPATLPMVISAAVGAIGLAISYVVAPPVGADHSCPAGSRPADCHYPGDQTNWSIWWTVGGVIVGICIGLLASGHVRHRPR